MTPIRALLDRVRWDRDYARAAFVIGYWDRVAQRVERVPLRRVRFPAGGHFSFEAVEDDGSAHSVPLHRVREVWRDGILVWRRSVREAAR